MTVNRRRFLSALYLLPLAGVTKLPTPGGYADGTFLAAFPSALRAMDFSQRWRLAAELSLGGSVDPFRGTDIDRYMAEAWRSAK